MSMTNPPELTPEIEELLSAKEWDEETAEYDWVEGRTGDRLHHLAEVTENMDLVPLSAYGVTSCGRPGLWNIPGLFTRLSAMRCRRCCAALGYPPGKGSPKNDDACRKLLGLL